MDPCSVILRNAVRSDPTLSISQSAPELLGTFAIVLVRTLGEFVQFLRRERLGAGHSTILPRPALSCPRLTLLSTRRRCEPFVGRVGLRFRGTLLALSMSSCKRASASSRLRSCVRYPCALMITTPSAVIR